MANPKVLFIEDSESDQALVMGVLRQHCDLVPAKNLASARAELESGPFDLILLDVILPDGDGFHFFSQIQADKRWREIPVIFMTAKSGAPDEVLGFSLGAEDYIAKPFDPLKLKARIEARLRKISEQKGREPVLRKDGLRVDISQQKVFLRTGEGEESLDLTPLELKILAHLMRHEDQVLSREALISEVWGPGVNVIDRAVDMHMSNLRKKITTSSYTIRSVHGIGYRFVKKTG